jgi:DNA/RNA endonuclease YhcR with UshA esterase domain
MKHMNEKTLLALSLACSGVGLLLLTVASLLIESPETKISELDDHLNNDVTVTGTVQDVRIHDGNTFIILEQKSAVNAIFFGSANDIKAGTNITITGEVRTYKGKKELIGSSIRGNR